MRKKKCDEASPYCSTCVALAITCYGYGPKPEWMDNGEKERLVTNSLKETVRHTSRRKGVGSSNQTVPLAPIAPKSLDHSTGHSTSNTGSSSQYDTASTSDCESAHENDIIMGQDQFVVCKPIVRAYSIDSNHHQDAPSTNHSLGDSITPTAAEESVLLMHFLDSVFPLQYPMYKPKSLEGGRGWLLALLLRSNPLYHAALAFSAYHRRIMLDAKISQPRRLAAVVQQEYHLQVCILGMNQSAQESCSQKDKLGIGNSVMQLIFYEVITHWYNSQIVCLRCLKVIHRPRRRMEITS